MLLLLNDENNAKKMPTFHSISKPFLKEKFKQSIKIKPKFHSDSSVNFY